MTPDEELIEALASAAERRGADPLLRLLATPGHQRHTFTYAGTDLVLIGKDNASLAATTRALRVARTRRLPDGTYAITARQPEQMPRPRVAHKPSRRRVHRRAAR